MSGNAHGGNDTLIGGTGSAVPSRTSPSMACLRDARQRPRRNDHLSGGAGSFIFLVGDAGIMDGDSRAAMTR